MKGDFSRNTFDAQNHFSRVLLQQGRVLLDADWNEQMSILLHYMQTLARDIFGPHGGPVDDRGFEILDRGPNFGIGKGHYYVDGILCENDASDLKYEGQEGYPSPPPLDPEKHNLVYLDVWERHITYIEDDSIREVALGDVDTATRAKVIWQVKAESTEATNCAELLAKEEDPGATSEWEEKVEAWQPANRGKLAARAKPSDSTGEVDPCMIDPESRYRGMENQLYRVEIHRGGKAWNVEDSTSTKETSATFKWSRENGCVVFPIRAIAGKIVTLEHLGRDARSGLQENDWVEIVDDDYILKQKAAALRQIKSIDRIAMTVTLYDVPAVNISTNADKHPLMRLWNHKAGGSENRGLTLNEGAALIEEGNDAWLELEDNVQIWFQPGGHTYRTGDYWLIPARTVTGDVEWPGPVGAPESLPPHGVEHHYAPLAIITTDDNAPVEECRREFAYALGKDHVAAIKKATNPSGENPFVTPADLPFDEDGEDWKAAIEGAIGANGENCFVTQDKIPDGEDWKAAIEGAVGASGENHFVTKDEIPTKDGWVEAVVDAGKPFKPNAFVIQQQLPRNEIPLKRDKSILPLDIQVEDWKGAVENAETPHAGNPFVTKTQFEAAISGERFDIKDDLVVPEGALKATPPPPADLTSEQLAAIANADSPGEDNPFVTRKELPANRGGANWKTAVEAATRPNRNNKFITEKDINPEPPAEPK